MMSDLKARIGERQTFNKSRGRLIKFKSPTSGPQSQAVAPVSLLRRMGLDSSANEVPHYAPAWPSKHKASGSGNDTLHHASASIPRDEQVNGKKDCGITSEVDIRMAEPPVHDSNICRVSATFPLLLIWSLISSSEYASIYTE